ncbi:hypothetical protein [Flavobacterium sp. LB1P62]|uniref:hypothetical protein n=1 Tax=unclassified Flavobacterium TaxID=196869 RepID=UPI003AAF739B
MKIKTSLPVIADFIKGDLNFTKIKKSKFKFIESTYYQTTKSFYGNYYKPLFLKRENAK